jgi:DNA-binding response OmpR family regulator
LGVIVHSSDCPSKTVFVIDDDEAIREVIGRFLSAKGFRVLRAASGEEALTLFRENPPASVFIDLMMPGLNGLQTLREMRAISPSFTAIIVSSFHNEDIVKDGRELGVADYIIKPFSLQDLEYCVERNLKPSAPE